MPSVDLRYYDPTMRTFFRLFLWLSISVLSIQGGAAMATGQREQAAHETIQMAGHCHHRSVEQSVLEHRRKIGSTTSPSSHTKCAACASCCVGAAAPPALLPTLHAPLLASTLHALAEVAMTSVFPSALERPPRHLFV
jgi:hypothetical protein